MFSSSNKREILQSETDSSCLDLKSRSEEVPEQQKIFMVSKVESQPKIQEERVEPRRQVFEY